MRDSTTYPSVIEAIGQTPLVELSRITSEVEGTIVAKLEYLNPGFSKKDRIAKQIIQDAEDSGKLRPGQAVVELTSGNTGTGLAIICGIKGYPFIAVMSRGNSAERARMMSALGAEVILVDQVRGSQPGQVSGADLDQIEKRARKIVLKRNAFRADQFVLKGNFRAHYLHTGPEILSQAQVRIDAYCDFVGSGGTFAGCAAALKEADPTIKCYVVEPQGAAVLAGQTADSPNHRIQGGGYARADLPLLDTEMIEGYIQVTDDESRDTARRLAATEGIFAGFSSGANIAAAIRLLRIKEIHTVATTINDSGLKYLSTGLWP